MPSNWEYLREYLGNLMRDEQKERFGEVEQPWDFWGNIVRFWGLGEEEAERPRPTGRVQKDTFMPSQWGKENIKVMKEILEE